MIDTIYLKISGDPIAQPRHKISRWGGKYLPKKANGDEHPVIEWKRRVRQALKDNYQGEVLKGVAFKMRVHFFKAHPKSLPKSTFSSYNCIPLIKTPDLDNLVKAIKDSITIDEEAEAKRCEELGVKKLKGKDRIKVLWGDDSQVTKVTMEKYYHKLMPDGGAFIEIEEMPAGFDFFLKPPTA